MSDEETKQEETAIVSVKDPDELSTAERDEIIMELRFSGMTYPQMQGHLASIGLAYTEWTLQSYFKTGARLFKRYADFKEKRIQIIQREGMEKAKKESKKIIATLIELSKTGTKDDNARVKACNILLDRIFGKPPQTNLNLNPSRTKADEIIEALRAGKKVD